MPDYLGPNQTRVLDAENRNFDSVVFQKRKPPLSCELNLINEIQQNRDQETIKTVIPSGWSVVGQIRDNTPENSCFVGDLLTSPSLPANSIKLISKHQGKETFKNVAFVNGWKILVQGSSSSDENNLITLAPASDIASRVDFVFLEVWKKLINTSDVIYKYGNVQYGGDNYTNDLIDPYIGKETSLRIQIQYRIRVVPGSISGQGINLDDYPEGFNPSTVAAQGAASSPLTTYSCSIFSPVAGDPGLWRAGFGGIPPTPGQPSDSQVLLGTTDGYSYAIPMFAIFRRNTNAYSMENNPLGSGKTLTDYLASRPSDRPDGKYSDWIVPSDIIDLRHRSLISGENLKEICEEAFDKLVANKLITKSSTVSVPVGMWGSKLMKVDSIGAIPNTEELENSNPDGCRRVFSNSTSVQTRTLIRKTVLDKIPAGGNWTTGDKFEISFSSYPSGSTITSIQQAYVQTNPYLNISGSYIYSVGAFEATIEITAPLGTSDPLIIEYTISFPAGNYGFSQVPTKFLEVRNDEDTIAIATEDQEVPVHGSDPVTTLTGVKYHTLRNRGGSNTHPYDFGHQMVYHALGAGSIEITIPVSIYGYDIIGVNDAVIAVDATTYGPSESITVSRDTSSYSITFGSLIPSGTDVRLTLYLGTRFFTMNKQGRAVTESYEMVELPGQSLGGAVYRIDSTNKPLLAVAAYANGVAFGYVDNTRQNLTLDTSSKLPVGTSVGICDVTFASAPSIGSSVSIPVMALSAIGSSEGYAFFYEYVPYQGLLDTSAQVKVLATGPSITTTAGSGAISDSSYVDGSVSVQTGYSYVFGTGTQWYNNVYPGDYIVLDGDTLGREYKISQVQNDTTIQIEIPMESSTGTDTYRIFSKDKPYFNQPNIIDRMPIRESAGETLGTNSRIGFSDSDDYPVLQNRIVNKTQDIASLDASDFTVGSNPVDMTSVARNRGRGRSTVAINASEAPQGQHTLGISFKTLFPTADYKRTYQSYIVDRYEDGTSGKLYMMVVGGESDTSGYNCYLNEKSTSDVVDFFHLPGRPLISE